MTRILWSDRYESDGAAFRRKAMSYFSVAVIFAWVPLFFLGWALWTLCKDIWSLFRNHAMHLALLLAIGYLPTEFLEPYAGTRRWEHYFAAIHSRSVGFSAGNRVTLATKGQKGSGDGDVPAVL